MNDPLAILVPVLARPHRVQPLLASITAATPEPHRVLFISDPDDTTEHAALERAGAEVLIVAGNYAHKINTAVNQTSEPLIFLGADDLHFHPGWLPAALKRLQPPVLVVGTNDLGNPRVIKGEHSTHTLVHRDYLQRGTIDEPGKLLHEGYLHEYVDDEFIETAIFRGAFAAATDSIVEHLHPNWGKAPSDDLYAAQRLRMRRGRRIYRQRATLWT